MSTSLEHTAILEPPGKAKSNGKTPLDYLKLPYPEESEDEAELTDGRSSIISSSDGSDLDDSSSMVSWTTRMKHDEHEIHRKTGMSMDDSRKELELEQLRDMIDTHSDDPAAMFDIFAMVMDNISDLSGLPELLPVRIHEFKQHFFTLLLLFVTVVRIEVAGLNNTDMSEDVIARHIKTYLSAAKPFHFPSNLVEACIATLRPLPNVKGHRFLEAVEANSNSYKRLIFGLDNNLEECDVQMDRAGEDWGVELIKATDEANEVCAGLSCFYEPSETSSSEMKAEMQHLKQQNKQQAARIKTLTQQTQQQAAEIRELAQQNAQKAAQIDELQRKFDGMSSTQNRVRKLLASFKSDRT